MRAVIVKAPGEVHAGQVPEPAPAKGQVIIQAAACGSCGTGIHIVDGAGDRRLACSSGGLGLLMAQPARHHRWPSVSAAGDNPGLLALASRPGASAGRGWR